MPKIKVNIDRLNWNFAWVVIAIKAFLLENLRLPALLGLDIWRHKISFWRRERVLKLSNLLPENGFDYKKGEFMSRIVLLDLKLTPMSISAIFKQIKIFHFQNFWDVSMVKQQQQPFWLINFAKIWLERVLRINLKVAKFWHHRVRGSWLTAVSLVIRASEKPPGPDRVNPSWSKGAGGTSRPPKVWLDNFW